MSRLKSLVLATYAGSMMLGSTALPTVAVAAPGDKCEVKLDRTYADGTYQVWKQEAQDGKCRCYVQTGKQPQSDTIERSIADLMRDRTCDSAPVQAVVSLGGATAGAGAAGLFGGGGGAVAAGVGLTAAAALGAAAVGDENNNDSPGS